jgi:hypothetical protein
MGPSFHALTVVVAMLISQYESADCLGLAFKAASSRRHAKLETAIVRSDRPAIQVRSVFSFCVKIRIWSAVERYNILDEEVDWPRRRGTSGYRSDK